MSKPLYFERNGVIYRRPSELEQATGMLGELKICTPSDDVPEEAVVLLLNKGEAADDLYEALKVVNSGQWKSVDRDNMEFTIRITCYTADKIRAALARAEEKEG